MLEKKENSQSRFEGSEWLRIAGIIVAYGLTIGGLVFVVPWLFSLSESWIIGFLLFVIVVPLFPGMQAILLRKEPVSLFIFLKIYVAEFASLFLQLSFLLVSAPFIVILVAGRLAVALLVAAVIAWFVVGLQQLGLAIGSKMLRDDMLILLQATIGLAIATGIYFFLERLFKQHEDGYFGLWASQFVKIREFFRYDALKDNNGQLEKDIISLLSGN